MFYSENFIKQIVNGNNIINVISKYTNLRRKKNFYIGLCPFHNEETPSLFVDFRNKTYHCYGCGKTGNVIDFIMEAEKCGFEKAVEILAKRIRIDIPTIETTTNKESIDIIKKINFEAARFYYKKLHESDNVGMNYFKKKRKLSDDIIKKFGLGLSGNFGSELYVYLKSKGFNEKSIVDSGLVFKNNESNGEPYCDKFWDRVIFPIMNENGQVVGFGGRVLNDKKPKYLNSPETAIFDKGNLLYGLNLARYSKFNNFIVCEGNIDVISLHQKGFTNAVASLGTALTKQQVRKMHQYTDSVYLAYDSDEAGVKAAMRAIDLCNEEKIKTKIINLQPYKDPDEFLNALGKEKFEDRIKSAEDTKRFKIRNLKAFSENNSEFYQKAVDILLENTVDN